MSDATKPFQNNTTATERLETLLNDKRVLRKKDTFASRANAELDLENSGRFAKPNTVIGPDGVQYPQQPKGSFSNQASVVPPEEALGFSVDDVPIVGEEFEVRASLERAAQEASEQTSLDDAEAPQRGAGLAPSSSSDVERPANPLPTNKLRKPQR